jgi:hypothetical protein
MKPYILIFQNDNEGGLRLIGPFADREKLKAYGRDWQERNGDDPRWQSVEMADHIAAGGRAHIRIETPVDCF